MQQYHHKNITSNWVKQTVICAPLVLSQGLQIFVVQREITRTQEHARWGKGQSRLRKQDRQRIRAALGSLLLAWLKKADTCQTLASRWSHEASTGAAEAMGRGRTGATHSKFVNVGSLSATRRSCSFHFASSPATMLLIRPDVARR